MSDAPEWISMTAVNFGWALSEPHERDGTDVRYIRADLHAARIADLERQLAEREAQVARLLEMQTEREVDHERQLTEAREVAVAITEQVATTRAYAADSGMDSNQIHLMETCTSHFLDYARILSALKGTP